MPDERKLKLVLCWHMHQPEYRDLRSGEYKLPWTYLHVIKDYVDMVAHLESTPGARAVVNFAPVLLEQIADYAEQIDGFLHNGVAIRDPLLAALIEPAVSAEPEERLILIKHCLRAHKVRQIERYPAYAKLAKIGDWLSMNPHAMTYINTQFLADLLVWYHLAWIGETVKRTDSRLKRLLDKATNFTLHDRRDLVEVISELLASVIGRYRALANNGQIELSMTPFAHPIMPLMQDIQSARDAWPDVHLPLLDQYPGGEDRVRWHLRKGIESFRGFFGVSPQGCWPSEGSVSESTLRLLSEYGFKWAASGGNVLQNSLSREHRSGENPHRPYRINDSLTVCFFRDDGLSDKIGFEYADWHADDAVADLVTHLENIFEQNGQENSVVSIIMDGENAWEHYPENGYYFLSALYQRLSNHPRIEMTTYGDCLSADVSIGQLSSLVAGSWVYGTFSTWIGDSDKNRGWDMLGDAKKCFDKVVADGRLNGKALERAELQLAICEGSDWFWWFGDYNPEATVSDFERQFRLNLANLYQLMGEEPPSYITEVFTHGTGAPPKGGAMRPGDRDHAV